MQYVKLALTYEQQATQLMNRGLVCEADELIARLKSVSYFRLSGYWFPFRQDDDSFVEGTTLAAIWRRSSGTCSTTWPRKASGQADSANCISTTLTFRGARWATRTTGPTAGSGANAAQSHRRT